MLNFACLAASLLLTAGVGAGYVSTPTRHYAPQLVNGVTYYGYDADFLADNALYPDVFETLQSTTLELNFGSSFSYSVDSISGTGNCLRIDFDISDTEPIASFVSYNRDTMLPLNAFMSLSAWSSGDLVIDLPLLPYIFADGVFVWYVVVVDFAEMGLDEQSAFVSGNSWNEDGFLAYTPAYTGTDVTYAITDGLGGIVPMGGALVDGFDAIALDDGVLTPVLSFGFILMGIGISVGIVKKCFNWVTGRHGM